MNRERILLNKLTANINGWLTQDEGFALYELAQKVRSEMSIVEIGSYEGLSTTCLLAGSETGYNPPVWAIDTFDDTNTPQRTNKAKTRHEMFWDNICERILEHNVRLIRDFSYNVAPKFEDKIGLIFIDGSHDYESVRRDITDWLPHMGNGGIMVFHDYNLKKGFPGVLKAVDEIKDLFRKYEIVSGNMLIGWLK